MFKRLAGSALALALVALALTSCTSSSKSAPKPGDHASVSVAYVPIINFAPLFLAADKGYFEDANLDVKLNVNQGGAETIGLLGNGKLDALFGGLSSGTISAINKGIAIKLVLPISEHPGAGGGYAGALVVRKSESTKIKSAADLRGKKIAVNAPGGLAEYLLSKTLAKYGMTETDLHVTYLALPNMTAALQNGAIDAALMGDPFATAAVKQNVATILASDSEPTPGLQSSLLFYGPKFIADKNDAAKRFAVAIAKATRDLGGKGLLEPQNLAIVSKYTKIPEDDLKSLQTTTVFSTDPSLDPGALADQQAFFIKTGSLKISAPIPAGKIIDDQFSKYVLSKLGPYNNQ